MLRLLCLLGFISLFIGCPAKGGDGSNDGSENTAASQAVPADSAENR